MLPFCVACSGADAPAFGIEPERARQFDLHRVVRLEALVRGCRDDQLLLAAVESDVHKVQVAQAFDASDPGGAVYRVGLLAMQPQVLGPRADGRCMLRGVERRNQRAREQVDARLGFS